MEETLNVANCTTSKVHWGYDEIINFCNNTSHKVEWVTFEWFMVWLLIAVAIGFVALMVWMIYDISTY